MPSSDAPGTSLLSKTQLLCFPPQLLKTADCKRSLEVCAYTLHGALSNALSIRDLLRRQSLGNAVHHSKLSRVESDTGLSQTLTPLGPCEQFVCCLHAGHTQIFPVRAKANIQYLRVHLIPQDVAVDFFSTQGQFQVMIDCLTKNADLTVYAHLMERRRQLYNTHLSHIAGDEHDFRLELLHCLDGAWRIAYAGNDLYLLLIKQQCVQPGRSYVSRTDRQDSILYRKLRFASNRVVAIALLGASLRVHVSLPCPTACAALPDGPCPTVVSNALLGGSVTRYTDVGAVGFRVR